jgi:hypothetical protein
LKEEDIGVLMERFLVFFYQLRGYIVGKKKKGLFWGNLAVFLLLRVTYYQLWFFVALAY